MFSVSFVLVPHNSLYLMPGSLTLWPDVGNGELLGFIERIVLLLPAASPKPGGRKVIRQKLSIGKQMQPESPAK